MIGDFLPEAAGEVAGLLGGGVPLAGDTSLAVTVAFNL